MSAEDYVRQDETVLMGITPGDGSPERQKTGGPTGPESRQSVSLNRIPLLDMITRQSMDEDYAIVAERKGSRPAGSASPERRWGTAATVGVVAASALLATVAGVQAARNADVTALGRASLVERINLARENVRDLQNQAGELSSQNVTLEENARRLRERESDLTSRVRRLGARTGYLAVSGPGVRVVVDDAPGGGLDQTVRDDDLILLVDGLWAAGAEAIAINGQRLTVLTPIQNSGQAIHVNVRPLAPPYTVEAIGDPDTMQGRLLASTSGSTFQGVADALGFLMRVEDVDELNLPATRVRTLRHAEQMDRDTISSTRKGDDE